KSLGVDEIGLLIVTENHRIQFPPDIEVFYVAPPALDEYKRWLRRQEESPKKEKPASQEKPEKGESAKAEKSPEAGPKTGENKSETSKPAKRTRKKKSS
ncbi:MAG: hypothetical protein WC231_07095, partial [Dehalococcoidales bacterium]